MIMVQHLALSANELLVVVHSEKRENGVHSLHLLSYPKGLRKPLKISLVKTAILLCKLLCKIYPTWKKRQYKTIVCHVIASDYTKDIRISQDIWFILPEISDQPITSNRSSLSSNLQVFCEQ